MYCCIIFSTHIIVNKKWCNNALVRNDTRREQVARQYTCIHLWTNWHPTENNPSIIPIQLLWLLIHYFILEYICIHWYGFYYCIQWYECHYQEIFKQIIFQQNFTICQYFPTYKKNSSCSLLIYRLVEITNYFCTLKSVDIYSIVKTVG